MREEKKGVSAWGVLKETWSEAGADQVTRLGAALAYYTLFSMAPLVLIMILVVGLVFGADAARGMVVQQLGAFLGQEKAKAVQDLISQAQQPTAGGLAGAIGLATLLWGASSVVGELQTSLNAIYGVAVERLGWWATAKGRLISLGFVLGLGFLLLVSLLLGAGISAAGRYLGGLFLSEPLLHAANLLLSFGLIAFLFAAMFRYLPQAARIAWRDAWVGALATAALFVLGNFALGIYLGKAGPSSAYGAAGSLLAFLLWAYYCAQILYYGAEFTQVWARERGRGLTLLRA